MNRRQWKKACKRAAAELELRFPGEYSLTTADGDECVRAPQSYAPPRWDRVGSLSFARSHATPPRGTPLVWERTSYEYDEWDARTALDVLEQRLFWESHEPSEIEMAEEPFECMLDDAARAVFRALQFFWESTGPWGIPGKNPDFSPDFSPRRRGAGGQ